MKIALDYGYRSKCCYAPIRLGTRKVKNTNRKINVWVCCKCNARDVDLVEYNENDSLGTSHKFKETDRFAPDE